MLSNELMGLLALAILWVNTLLVVGAAWQRIRSLRARLASLGPVTRVARGEVGVVQGKIASSDGPFAVAVVEQVGRYGAGSGRSIVWQDREYRSEVKGGVVETAEGPVRVDPADQAHVWPSTVAMERASACGSRSSFDDAFVSARKAKGFKRTVSASLRAGDEVWIAGELASDDGALIVRSASGSPLLVSAIDPAAWCKKKLAFMGLVFIPLVLIGAALVTALALVPPHFGTVSMIGGGLGLLYFLLVLPAGTSARDFVREPHLRILRGKWTEPNAAEATSVQAASASSPD